MTYTERAVLDFLLQADFPGVEALRDQARHADVDGLCGCGCPSFGLTVDKSRAARAETNPRVPVDVEASSSDPHYELLLFTEDGWLWYVELVAYGADVRPSTFPPLSLFDPPAQLR